MPIVIKILQLSIRKFISNSVSTALCCKIQKYPPPSFFLGKDRIRRSLFIFYSRLLLRKWSAAPEKSNLHGCSDPLLVYPFWLYPLLVYPFWSIPTSDAATYGILIWVTHLADFRWTHIFVVHNLDIRVLDILTLVSTPTFDIPTLGEAITYVPILVAARSGASISVRLFVSSSKPTTCT